MRLIQCLSDHSFALVLLAAGLCVIGSLISLTLLQKAFKTRASVQSAWVFLGAVALAYGLMAEKRELLSAALSG